LNLGVRGEKPTANRLIQGAVLVLPYFSGRSGIKIRHRFENVFSRYSRSVFCGDSSNCSSTPASVCCTHHDKDNVVIPLIVLLYRLFTFEM